MNFWFWKRGTQQEDDKTIDLFAKPKITERRWWDKYKVVIASFLGVATVSAVTAIVFFSQWYIGGTQAQNIALDIKDNVMPEASVITTTVTLQPFGLESEKPVVVEDESKFAFLNVDWKKLKEMYPNAVAWLRVAGTSIDMPVAQGEDNAFYLSHDISGANTRSGWCFADYREDLTSLPFNTIIYGHNMADGQIFGTLRKSYHDGSISDTENQFIYYATPAFTAVYQIYTGFQVVSSEFQYAKPEVTIEERASYLKSMCDANIVSGLTYDTSALSYTDKIITLSTCADAEGAEKFAYQGVLVDIRYTDSNNS